MPATFWPTPPAAVQTRREKEPAADWPVTAWEFPQLLHPVRPLSKPGLDTRFVVLAGAAAIAAVVGVGAVVVVEVEAVCFCLKICASTLGAAESLAVGSPPPPPQAPSARTSGRPMAQLIRLPATLAMAVLGKSRLFMEYFFVQM